MKLSMLAVIAAVSLVGAPVLAADPAFDGRINGLARTWAHVNYEVRDKSAQATEAAKLAADADALAKQYPNRAEPLVWEAISTATEAGAKGGMGGLALAKSARGMLERAERINPAALGDGSVYTSLGSLYAQVPGFPIGFGDAGKARAYLTKALAANPSGVDSNFFYGDFLIRQGDYVGAEVALQRALNAPARPGREVADRGRKAQAAELLATARKKAHG
ncbi:tetratricopeptide repeat protein [Caulobacter sp. DWR2-3-1b2]|uniref:tetratricopeptide repeat protein n=1 Tax=unclassified Caulobacter TaxID=2648921 RepID=UPI003CEBE5C6